MDNTRLELGRSFSLLVLGALGVVWGLIAAGLIEVGIHAVAHHVLGAIVALALGIACLGVAIYHCRLVWTHRVPRWFTEFIHSA